MFSLGNSRKTYILKNNLIILSKLFPIWRASSHIQIFIQIFKQDIYYLSKQLKQYVRFYSCEQKTDLGELSMIWEEFSRVIFFVRTNKTIYCTAQVISNWKSQFSPFQRRPFNAKLFIWKVSSSEITSKDVWQITIIGRIKMFGHKTNPDTNIMNYFDWNLSI